jgi:CheY-like chemotaxis protein
MHPGRFRALSLCGETGFGAECRTRTRSLSTLDGVAIGVLLVDDVQEVRWVIAQALRLQEGYEVVGEAADGHSAIERARESQPDIVVLDLDLPDLAGRDVISGLRHVAPTAQVVVFTGTESAENASDGDVEAFVSKDEEVTHLIDLIVSLKDRPKRLAVHRVDAHAAEVAGARNALRSWCRDWGCTDVVDDAVVVVSELVTNAVLHAGTGCELRARVSHDRLRIEVLDEGAGSPDPQLVSDEDEHGRGLILVSALSAAWGVEALDVGKIVWAELPFGAPGAGSEPPAKQKSA